MAEPQEKPFPFLRLPAELRMKIYELVFEEKTARIFCGRKGVEDAYGKEAIVKETDKCKNSSAITIRGVNGTITRKFRTPGVKGKKADKKSQPIKLKHEKLSPSDVVPFSFLLVCKQMHQETRHYLYSKTSFLFRNINAVQRFLKHTPLPALESVRRLSLYNGGYGEPRFTEFRKFKMKHDLKWLNLCKVLAIKMRGLRELSVILIISDWPTCLNLKTPWADALLRFKDMGLDRVEVTLRSVMFSKKCLASAAGVVERALLSEEGLKRMEEERFQKELKRAEDESRKQIVPKARKVLVIRT